MKDETRGEAYNRASDIGDCYDDANDEIEKLVQQRDNALCEVATLRKKTVKRLELELESEKRAHAENVKDFGPIVDATNGHTLENIREIMKAAPPAEDLDGMRLSWRHVAPNEPVWDWAGEGWDSRNRANGKRMTKCPIVEYIEGDEITDELVLANGGRVPCEVRDHEVEEWVPNTLYEVEGGGLPFCCKSGSWKHCRIKKADLKEQP